MKASSTADSTRAQNIPLFICSERNLIKKELCPWVYFVAGLQLCRPSEWTLLLAATVQQASAGFPRYLLSPPHTHACQPWEPTQTNTLIYITMLQRSMIPGINVGSSGSLWWSQSKVNTTASRLCLKHLDSLHTTIWSIKWRIKERSFLCVKSSKIPDRFVATEQVNTFQCWLDWSVTILWSVPVSQKLSPLFYIL